MAVVEAEGHPADAAIVEIGRSRAPAGILRGVGTALALQRMLLPPPTVFARNFVPSRPSLSLTPQLRALVQALQERRARTMADRELARRVQNAIDQAARTAGGGLSFYVHEGTVAVYGSVSDEASRQAVLGIAADQPGARRIIDHLVDADRPTPRTP